GSCDIMLGQDDFAKGRDRRKGDGFRLWVATVQDIIAVAARVKAKGWTLDREPSETPWGDWAFALTDPDGFKITRSEEHTSELQSRFDLVCRLLLEKKKHQGKVVAAAAAGHRTFLL